MVMVTATSPGGSRRHITKRRAGPMPGSVVYSFSLCRQARRFVPVGNGAPPLDPTDERSCEECNRIYSALYDTDPLGGGWTRQCRSCEEELPASRFRANRQSRDGLAHTCESCRLHQQREREQARSRAERDQRERSRSEESIRRANRNAETVAELADTPFGAPCCPVERSHGPLEPYTALVDQRARERRNDTIRPRVNPYGLFTARLQCPACGWDQELPGELLILAQEYGRLRTAVSNLGGGVEQMLDTAWVRGSTRMLENATSDGRY